MALTQIQAEGAAARARINYASLTGSIPVEKRASSAALRVVIAIVSCLVITTIVAAATGRWPFAQAPPNLDQVIADLNVGSCANFTNNYSDIPISRPSLVSCSNSNATFVVRWAGIRASGDCPRKYSLFDAWQNSSGKVVCMARVYKVGQCMQGKHDGKYIEWFDDAVVTCGTKLTKAYPYVVIIKKIIPKASGNCPGHDTLDRRSRVNLCIGLLRAR